MRTMTIVAIATMLAAASAFGQSAGSAGSGTAPLPELEYLRHFPNTDIGGPFAPFDTMSGTLPGHSAHAGVEFQPTPNVSLSLGFGYTQQSGRIDSDISSPSLPGASPLAVSGRR